jgi:uncharacterized phage-associated protein
MNHVAFLATLYKYPISEFWRLTRLDRFVSSPRWRLPATAGCAEGSSVMASVFDVAAYILAKKGGMTAWKLQKLVYYSQAWSLVWDDRPLFNDRIEAWANGPVCPELYGRHRGRFFVSEIFVGNADALTVSEAETVDGVLDYYGGMEGQYLSDLTHAERPWKETRGELPPGVNSSREISLDLIAEYYGSIPPDNTGVERQ